MRTQKERRASCEWGELRELFPQDPKEPRSPPPPTHVAKLTDPQDPPLPRPSAKACPRTGVTGSVACEAAGILVTTRCAIGIGWGSGTGPTCLITEPGPLADLPLNGQVIFLLGLSVCV